MRFDPRCAVGFSSAPFHILGLVGYASRKSAFTELKEFFHHKNFLTNKILLKIAIYQQKRYENM
ncbi:MAG TPA: hypothetical protein DCF96_13105 [Rhodobacteraceae bacterium]|nr:hypothetical protein [Paracoccaceae bacterium]|tara:strand:- start:2710 stop:2901 length:192 start_codon:yes stop_codon:yes gene_type:complete